MEVFWFTHRFPWLFISPFAYVFCICCVCRKIHELIDDQSDSSIYKSPYAFRLIYNGRVLTGLMDGCPDNAELCDAQILVRHVSPFATRSINCRDASSKGGGGGSAVWDTIESLLSKTAGLVLILFIMAMGGAVGGAGMFFYLTGTLPDAQSAIKAAHKQRSGDQHQYHKDSAEHGGFFGKSEIDTDKYGRVGLMDEIEMTFTDAASPFDEYE
jgi:hypothetical protein